MKAPESRPEFHGKRVHGGDVIVWAVFALIALIPAACAFFAYAEGGTSLWAAIAFSVGVPAAVVLWARRGPAEARLARAALNAARSGDLDEAVGERLRPLAASDPRAARKAIAHYRYLRGSFDTDRAYRLLVAAINNESVQPIAPDREQLFQKERELGTMPLSEAFAQLARQEPQLLQLASTAESENTSDWRETIPLRKRSTSILLDSEDPLLESSLALSIVAQYLELLARKRLTAASDAYFASPRKRVVRAWRTGTDRP